MIKTFAVLWTITMFFTLKDAVMATLDVTNKASTDAEQAGAVIGTALGFSMIIGLWFVILVGALVIGVFLKKSSIVEKGPTGPLINPKVPDLDI